MKTFARSLIVVITIALGCPFLSSVTKAAEPELLNEAAIKAYLQKKESQIEHCIKDIDDSIKDMNQEHRRSEFQARHYKNRAESYKGMLGLAYEQKQSLEKDKAGIKDLISKL